MTKLADLIWKNAELLRGAFKENEYRKVILPFTILLRLDCVLLPTLDAVRAKHAAIKDKGYDLNKMLTPVSGYAFFNISGFTLPSVSETPDAHDGRQRARTWPGCRTCSGLRRLSKIFRENSTARSSRPRASAAWLLKFEVKYARVLVKQFRKPVEHELTTVAHSTQEGATEPIVFRLLMVPEKDEFLLAILSRDSAAKRLFLVSRRLATNNSLVPTSRNLSGLEFEIASFLAMHVKQVYPRVKKKNGYVQKNRSCLRRF